MSKQAPPGGFSLVEVVLALGICTFVLVALIGLFSSGWKMGRESEDQVQAANLASQIIALRVVSPTNGPTTTAAIPYTKMKQAYGNAYDSADKFVGFNGELLPDAAGAAYRIACNVGTNVSTGSQVSQVYLRLTWPPQAAATNAAGRYEVCTYVLLP
jgi:Tfp pilus assembly protein PilV